MDFNIFWANLTAVLNSSKLSVPDLSASDMSMYFRKSCSCEEYARMSLEKVFTCHRLDVYVELFAEVAARQPQLLRGDLEVVVQVHLCRVALVTRVTCPVSRAPCPHLGEHVVQVAVGDGVILPHHPHAPARPAQVADNVLATLFWS